MVTESENMAQDLLLLNLLVFSSITGGSVEIAESCYVTRKRMALTKLIYWMTVNLAEVSAKWVLS